MSPREIRCRPVFERALKRLSRKHRSLENDVPKFLHKVARDGPTEKCDRIENVGGNPVFKIRLRIDGMGIRGSARLIYYCDDNKVIGLFLFVKSEQENMTSKVILDALKNVPGLFGEREDS